MKTYETYLERRGETALAEHWAEKLGKQSNATAPHVGTISSFTGLVCIHYQPSDGAKNYHDAPAGFLSALEKVLKMQAPQLIEQTLGVMRSIEAEAAIACEKELDRMRETIAKARASDAAESAKQ